LIGKREAGSGKPQATSYKLQAASYKLQEIEAKVVVTLFYTLFNLSLKPQVNCLGLINFGIYLITP
jgi:hypothetical protein